MLRHLEETTEIFPFIILYRQLDDCLENGIKHKLSTYNMSNKMMKKNKLEKAKVLKTVINEYRTEIYENRPISITPWEKKFRIILFYSQIQRDFGTLLGKEEFKSKKCEKYDCRITNNHRYFKSADVVIWHSPHHINNLPTLRLPNQRWTYLNMESPFYEHEAQEMNNVFNWTMTYRFDSDVLLAYFGKLVKNSNRQMNWLSKTDNGLNMGKNKKRLLAWFVSRCDTQSKREIYIKHLQNYMEVDIYGYCGNFTCSKSDDCMSMLEDKYYFYFAGENSLCVDYITEKFWRTFAARVVPLVYGGGNYSKFVPSNSFVNIEHFPNPKDLSIHLKRISQDIHLYNQFFEYKKYLDLKQIVSGSSFCDMCEMLHSEKEMKKRQYYHRFADQWNPKEQCFKPDFITSSFQFR
ncbi:hypothetical protein SNEBB_005603 [Seison nebaliae]|nr:hypothetical protein SNEBB_005603 [Seison nebaliae]